MHSLQTIGLIHLIKKSEHEDYGRARTALIGGLAGGTLGGTTGGLVGAGVGGLYGLGKSLYNNTGILDTLGETASSALKGGLIGGVGGAGLGAGYGGILHGANPDIINGLIRQHNERLAQISQAAALSNK